MLEKKIFEIVSGVKKRPERKFFLKVSFQERRIFRNNAKLVAENFKIFFYKRTKEENSKRQPEKYLITDFGYRTEFLGFPHLDINQYRSRSVFD